MSQTLSFVCAPRYGDRQYKATPGGADTPTEGLTKGGTAPMAGWNPTYPGSISGASHELCSSPSWRRSHG